MFRSHFLAMLAALLLFLPACTEVEQERIRIATNSWPGYQLFHYARHQGLWSEDEVDVVPLRSASQVMLALEADIVNMATLTLDETMQMLDRGLDLHIVAVVDISHGADLLLAKPHLTTLADLKGKTLVFESTALGAYLMQRALTLAGLSAEQVRLQSQNAEHHEEAFSKKNVDAVITYEPFASRIRKMGAQELFSSKDIPNEVIDVLVARKDRISTEQLNHLLLGYYHAYDHYRAHPDVFYEYVAAHLNMSVIETQRAFSSIAMPNAHESGHIMEETLRQTWPRMAQVLMQAQLITKEPSIEAVIPPFKFSPLGTEAQK